MSPGHRSHHSTCQWTCFQEQRDKFQALEIQEDLTGVWFIVWWPQCRCRGQAGAAGLGLSGGRAQEVCGAITVPPEGRSAAPDTFSGLFPQGTDWTCPVQRVALSRVVTMGFWCTGRLWLARGWGCGGGGSH